jgi:phenylalanyl-tRNA synthetase alpha chain
MYAVYIGTSGSRERQHFRHIQHSITSINVVKVTKTRTTMAMTQPQTPPDISQLQQEALDAVQSAETLENLEQLRVQYLGKKGDITGLLKSLGSMAPDQRKEFGASVNRVKQQVAEAMDVRKATLADAALQSRLQEEQVDISLEPRPEQVGKIHPISHVIDEIVAIFARMGFQVAVGPDVEDDFHNFTALNIPPEHPARQMHDTFYLQGDGKERPVLRTHTSPVQIRTMINGKPPFRVIAPGATYRSDSDATHTPMFHQVEGLVIDKAIHMGHLKGCLHAFLKDFFEVDFVPMRFRNSFFPFTEPSAEVDVGCARSKEGMQIGAGDDWLEILGCGMVHPNVLRNCELNPEEWQGFAFGLGVERLAMLKYGMADLRQFFDGDLRWLEHYGFSALHKPSLTGGLAG